MPAKTGSKVCQEELRRILGRFSSVVVALSGGRDSSFLLWACSQVIESEHITAVTFRSDSFSHGEAERAQKVTDLVGVSHHFVDTPEFNDENFLQNDLLRCYYCKRKRFRFLLQSYPQIPILEGSHRGDLGQYRPGMRAVEELGIHSPMLRAGLTSQDIDNLCVDYGLPFKDYQPESCLATRIKTGQRIDPTVLQRLESLEEGIKHLGLSLVRARYSYEEIRLEVLPEEMNLAFSNREILMGMARQQGFTNLSLDLAGYPQGKNNH